MVRTYRAIVAGNLAYETIVESLQGLTHDQVVTRALVKLPKLDDQKKFQKTCEGLALEIVRHLSARVLLRASRTQPEMPAVGGRQ